LGVVIDASRMIAELRAAGGDTTDVEVKSAAGGLPAYGDYVLSDLEEQGFLAARRPPLFDRSPVEDAQLDDLDTQLVDAFLDAVRERDASGLGRFDDDTELLRRAGVILTGGQPTVAGLLALGVHPQQWFPRYVIQMSAHPLASDPPETRARNQTTVTGSIARMLDAALLCARRTFDTSIVSEPDGTVHDRSAYPLVAFRELIANALVHRDLDHWSSGLAVEVRLRRDRLVVSNPGGLYGITVDRLGRDAVTSARNARLVAICQHVRSPETGARVIEALASGIPTITEALAEYHLPPAHYIDSGIRFTAVLHRSSTTLSATKPGLNDTERQIYQALSRGARSVADLGQDLNLAAPNIRKALRNLGAQGLVTQLGGR
jgi:ATP-dependent DNA helicase RecG